MDERITQQLDRIRGFAGSGREPRLLDVLAVVLVWATAWFAVRTVGDLSVASAGVFGLPVALASLRFGWTAGGLTAIVSGAYAGPLSPALGTPVSDVDTVTFTVIFLAVAAAGNVLRPSLRSENQQPEAARDTFGGVARELHTPVQAIRGAVELLTRIAPADGEERVAVATLGRAADRLHELEVLLSAVGEELGTERRADDQTLVDLRLVAGDVAADLRRQGGLTRLRFDASHDADVVMSHEERMHLLLRCLVGDALESTSGDQHVDCSLRRDEGNIVLRVSFPSDGRSTLGARIRLVAAEELAGRLGGAFDALEAAGSVQVTVRLPQRRTTDPTGDDRQVPRTPDAARDIWTSTGQQSTAPTVWAVVAGS